MFVGCGDCVLTSGLAGNVVLVGWFCGGRVVLGLGCRWFPGYFRFLWAGII